MAAFWIGTSSSSRPSVSTKPPTCCERWRGKPHQGRRQFERQGQPRIGGIEAGLAHMLDVDAACRRMPQTVSAMTPTVSGDRPSALPTSRMALRLR